jgi:hypothetical protein
MTYSRKRYQGVIALILVAGAAAFLLRGLLGGADRQSEAAFEIDGQGTRDLRRFRAPATPPKFVTPDGAHLAGGNVEAEKANVKAVEAVPVGNESVVTNAHAGSVLLQRSSPGDQLRALRNFDPAAYQVIWREGRREYFGAVGGIGACGLAFLQRRGRDRWSFQETVELNMTVGDGRIRFTDANFPNEGMLDTSDEEFRSCYRAAIRKIELSCPECGEGSAVIPWRIRSILYQRGQDPLPGIRDRNPRMDPALIIRTN